tara:strand:+ start:312 stop:524 length:213 start_codon:yes stop_codon:yes gene_type:complete
MSDKENLNWIGTTEEKSVTTKCIRYADWENVTKNLHGIDREKTTSVAVISEDGSLEVWQRDSQPRCTFSK